MLEAWVSRFALDYNGFMASNIESVDNPCEQEMWLSPITMQLFAFNLQGN